MNLRSAGLVAAYLLFPVSILLFALAYTKAYPVWETWYFIDVWRQFAQGEGWLPSLFISRWGHIHALPNFVNLLVGSATCYSMLADVVVIWLVAGAALFVTARQLPRNALFALGAASALFTARAAEVWLNSWNLMWSLSLLQAALMATVLARRPTGRSVALAACIGLASIFTAGQGLVVVAAGAVPLWVHARRDKDLALWLWLWLGFVAVCYLVFSSIVGAGGPASSLLNLNLLNAAALLAYGIGEGPLYIYIFGALAALATACLVWLFLRPGSKTLTERDLFWLYMAAMLGLFVLLLTITRPGLMLSRYLLLLWLAPTVLMFVLYRASEGSRPGRAAVWVLCAGWLLLNSWSGYFYNEMVNGWEGASRDVVTLARTNPAAVRAEMLKGVSSNDVPLMAQGLLTMQRLGVNLYCKR